MKANTTPANVSNLLTAAAYVRNQTIINGNQAAQLDAMIGQIKDLTTKIEAVPAKIADLAAQGKEKAVAMWERMAARYRAQFADVVAELRAWLVDFKANRPNVQINLNEPEDHEPTTPDNNTPNVSDLARWIDLQLSTIIEGVSAGYTLGNCNSVWIDKGSTVFNVSLANGETVEIDSDNYNTAEEIANAIISTLNNTTPATMNTNETTVNHIRESISRLRYELQQYHDNASKGGSERRRNMILLRWDIRRLERRLKAMEAETRTKSINGIMNQANRLMSVCNAVQNFKRADVIRAIAFRYYDNIRACVGRFNYNDDSEYNKEYSRAQYMNANKTKTPEFSELTPAGQCLYSYLRKDSFIYESYTQKAIEAIVNDGQTISSEEVRKYIKNAIRQASWQVEKDDHLTPTAQDIEQVTRNYVAYIVDCAK